MRDTLALQTTFEDPGKVEPVGDDIDACGLVYADPPTVEMIEEELCFVSPDGTHTYKKTQNYCMHCGMAAPWVRRDACRS